MNSTDQKSEYFFKFGHWAKDLARSEYVNLFQYHNKETLSLFIYILCN